MSGTFITFEGPDGSGKSTIIKKIYEQLLIDFPKKKIVLTREPGGTNNKIAEDIRNILLNKIDYKIDYHAEALLFAASRAQHVHDFIEPNLKQGNIVLCDRYIDSSIVYQGYGRKLGVDNIWNINKFAMHGVLPHLTLILMIKPEIGLARINANANREVNRMDKEKLVMHQQVYKAYSSIIKDDKTNRIKSIDASKSIEKVFNECYRNVRTKIK